MTIAIDCDLRKMYAWGTDGLVYRGTDPDELVQTIFDRYSAGDGPGRILFEIASAKDYADTSSGRASTAAAYHKRRWMLYNMHVATLLNKVLAAHMLYAPSSKWTRGHPLDRRHAIAGADAKQKDLRECQSMLWFYKHHPEDWTSLEKYLEDL